MQVIKNDMIVHTDIDDTLAMWNNVDYNSPGPDKIKFLDPTDNSTVYLVPHISHIKLLRKYKAQGYFIIAWSAAGYRWCESVIRTLGLDGVVDICMGKNLKYIDDLQAKEVLGTRVYIPFEQKNKIIEPGERE